MQLRSTLAGVLVLGVVGVNAHTVAWVKGMYCLGGNNASVNDYNTNTAVNPLFNLTKENWWFQHDRGCDKVPPKAGDILSLPANGNFTVELGHNRAMTTLSREGKAPSDWPDGQNHPDDYTAAPGQECVSDGALHTVNQTLAWGSAWAISYQSDLSQVTMDNLVVFSTLAHTPWKRLATYQVPDLPACPPGGCTCAWLWVPRGCGEPNMYMAGYKCNVTNAKSTKKLGTALPPTYCKFDQSKCQKGAKQMIAWNQQTGVNVQVPGGYYPGYNSVNGFSDGAQTDIFV